MERLHSEDSGGLAAFAHLPSFAMSFYGDIEDEEDEEECDFGIGGRQTTFHFQPPEDATVEDVLDALGKWRKMNVIQLTPDMTIEMGMEIISKHKIRAAPLVSSEGKILQMLDLKDILEMIATCYEKGISLEASINHMKLPLSTFLLKPVEHTAFINESSDAKQSIVELVNKKFLEQKVHRLATQNEEGQLVNILTQSDVITFLSNDTSRIGTKGCKKLKDLDFNKKEIVVERETTSAIKLLMQMRQHKVRVIPIVDAAGKFLGSFSASMIRGLRADQLPLLEKPALELLKELGDYVEPLKFSDTATLEECIHALSRTGAYELFIVGKRDKFLSIVSLTDILKTVFSPTVQYIQQMLRSKPPVVPVGHSRDLSSVLDTMNRGGVTAVPVMSDREDFLGFIDLHDILDVLVTHYEETSELSTAPLEALAGPLACALGTADTSFLLDGDEDREPIGDIVQSHFLGRRLKYLAIGDCSGPPDSIFSEWEVCKYLCQHERWISKGATKLCDVPLPNLDLTIHFFTPIIDALVLMKKHNVRAAPIVTTEGKLLGEISTEMLQGFTAADIPRLTNTVTEFLGLQQNICSERVVTVTAGETLYNLIKKVSTQKQSTQKAFLVDRSRAVQSVVTLSDIMRLVWGPARSSVSSVDTC
jgi:CBS-domain-containing membrane protein